MIHASELHLLACVPPLWAQFLAAKPAFFVACETCVTRNLSDNYGVSVTLEVSGFLVYQISQKPVFVTGLDLLNSF